MTLNYARVENIFIMNLTIVILTKIDIKRYVANFKKIVGRSILMFS